MSSKNNTLFVPVETSRREKALRIFNKLFSPQLSKDIEISIYDIHKTDDTSYTDKVKLIRSNINPKQNVSLYKNIINKKIKSRDLVSMSSFDMANTCKVQERETAKSEHLIEAFMTEEVREFQKKSILREDTTKKAKLWGADEETNGKL